MNVPNYPRKSLRLASRRAPSAARELVLSFIRNGEHSLDQLRTVPDREVETALAARGYDLAAAISKAQDDPHAPILEFENLLPWGSKQVFASPGVSIEATPTLHGVPIGPPRKIGEHGLLRHHEPALFESACKERDRAIAECDVNHLLHAVSDGIASIEAFVRARQIVHNSHCPPDQRLEERRPTGGHVTFDEKIKQWVPTMAGAGLDLGKSAGWRAFLRLRQIRDDMAQHPKPDAAISSLEQLADVINDFRGGIAGFLFCLYRVFGERVPGLVIRATYHPLVEVVTVQP